MSTPQPPTTNGTLDTTTPAPPSAPSQNTSHDPSGFLSEIIGAPVTVKLNSGVVYRGELQSVDGYMNIALEKTQEFAVVEGGVGDGAGKGGEQKLVGRRSYGDAFVRGNNVMYISADS